MDTLLSLSVPALVLVHLFAAPYTKVEESFNIQATHDILTFGIPSPLETDAIDFIRANYDHVAFPGSVPRTFVGASVLAGLARPFVGFVQSPEQLQILVRVVLGLINSLTLVRFRSAVDTAYGRTAGRFYLAFVASQFHLLFYVSRTLPNYLVLPLTTEATRAFLLALSTSPKLRASSKRRRLTLYLLTVSGIIFRSEIALLLATSTATLYLFSGLGVRQELIPAVFAGSLIALPTTLGLDTFLWRPRIALTVNYAKGQSMLQIPIPTWPELQAFFYNTVEGHSSDWGTSPFHYYFTSALPKLLFNPLISTILLPASFAIPALRRTSLTSLLPSLTFITIFSLLPHKEPRFIVYTLPLFLASASASASYIYTRRTKTLINRLLSLLVLASLPLSLLTSTALLTISSHNYPGGHALATLHAMASPTSITTSIPLQLALKPQKPASYLSKEDIEKAVAASAAARHANNALRDKAEVRVYLDNLATQTGVTRYQELNRGRSQGVIKDGRGGKWVYDKTEDKKVLARSEFWEAMDFVVTERPEKVPGSWEVLESVWGFDGVGFTLQDEGKGQVHVVDEVRRVFLPLPGVGKGLEGLVEGVVRRMAGVTGGKWPHVRLRRKLHILKRGSMGL
ncbi:hypothetical protein CAC42_5718 [Sphaceloma murrayae]|uniref:Mannosyltransferase n=1 Tax=Sphaceloma murrayae TaxID=2082308 RepID=A0A2K1QZ00_9PEZI|nr:hypothetical protein CAC42_5718 [Sphaceloma murrayae]